MGLSSVGLLNYLAAYMQLGISVQSQSKSLIRYGTWKKVADQDHRVAFKWRECRTLGHRGTWVYLTRYGQEHPSTTDECSYTVINEMTYWLDWNHEEGSRVWFSYNIMIKKTSGRQTHSSLKLKSHKHTFSLTLPFLLVLIDTAWLFHQLKRPGPHSSTDSPLVTYSTTPDSLDKVLLLTQQSLSGKEQTNQFTF